MISSLLTKNTIRYIRALTSINYMPKFQIPITSV